MKLEGCTALITGASAGIGREFVRQLATRAGALVLVARRRERLEQLRDELTKLDPNFNVQVHAADLTDAAQVNALCDSVEVQGITIDLLINNAGLGDHGRFLSSEPQRLDEMMQVNIVALTALTRRLLPAMVAKGRGGILNVSSIAGFLPLPEMAVYAASKAYVTAFSEGLRMELKGSGVSVTALCPGPTHTEFSDVATRHGAKQRHGPEFAYVSVENVVRLGLRALEQDRALAVPGITNKLATILMRLTPLPILRLAARLASR